MPDLIKQAVLNLVTNAIEAMKEGGSLRLKTACDNGCGHAGGCRFGPRHSSRPARYESFNCTSRLKAKARELDWP